MAEADVKGELEKLQQSMSTLVPIDGRKVGIEGDWALVDYDLALPDFKGEAPEAQARSRRAGGPGGGHPHRGAHLRAARRRGRAVRVTVPFTFPDDYKIAELRGQKGVFTVVLKALRSRETPALDDELVEDTWM